MPETRACKLPNFIIAGTPTSGTTSLHHYLRQHPQVYMSAIKEPTYFAAADMLARADFSHGIKLNQAALRAYLAGPRTQTAQYWITEWDDYVRLFENVRDQIAIGEASVNYIWLPSAAPAIRAKLPNAKLIFLLRDPSDRLLSWYLMTLKHDPQVTFRARLLKEMNERDNDAPSLLRQLDGGRYATHLKRFLDLFPRDQVRIYLYESLRANAPAVLRDIFAFLGVNPDQPIDMSHKHNETMMPRFPTLHRLRRWMPGNRSLTGWLPTPIRRTLAGIYRRPRGHQAMDPEDRQLAINYYRKEILRTQDLIGRDLSAWLR